MAKVGVNLKIDVTKIDKSKLFKGSKGTYLDAQVFVDIDQKDQYDNNGMITQAVSKEDRENGVQGAILGNCKVFWRDGSAPQQQQSQPQQQRPQQAPQQQQGNMAPPIDFDDDIPFAPVGKQYAKHTIHCL